jgi:hypothetical protein
MTVMAQVFFAIIAILVVFIIILYRRGDPRVGLEETGEYPAVLSAEDHRLLFQTQHNLLLGLKSQQTAITNYGIAAIGALVYCIAEFNRNVRQNDFSYKLMVLGSLLTSFVIFLAFACLIVRNAFDQRAARIALQKHEYYSSTEPIRRFNLLREARYWDEKTNHQRIERERSRLMDIYSLFFILLLFAAMMVANLLIVHYVPVP